MRLRRLAAARADPTHGQRLVGAGRRGTGRRRTTSSRGVERGLYIVGDKSWSIDMQRYNFQFTGQRFFKIEGGGWSGR